MSRVKLMKTINELQDIVDLLYQQNDKEAFEKLDTTLVDVEDTVDIMVSYQKENQEFAIDMNKIYSTLKQAMEALEAGDKVLVADIFQYELIEYLNELSSAMQ